MYSCNLSVNLIELIHLNAPKPSLLTCLDSISILVHCFSAA